MVAVGLAVALILASCTSVPISVDRTGAPSAGSSPTPEPSCLSGRRLEFLSEQFFVRYNARDLDGFLALFHTSVPAAGGGFGQYHDDPGGDGSTAGDRTSLADLLRRRWAMGDRFLSWVGSAMPDGLNYPNANPTISFTRSFAGVTQDGNVKLVCNAGLLVGVVMSSRQP